MKKIFLLFFISCTAANAQNYTVTPFVSGSTGKIKETGVRTYSLEAGKKYNAHAYYTHPDFGRIPVDAPAGKNLVEDLSKRKIDERYFIDLDEPHFFYIQKNSKPINFKRGDFFIAIDPQLKLAAPGLYLANNQPCATELNITTKRSAIYNGLDFFAFNHYSLKVVNNDNSMSIYNADWSDATVSQNECYIRSAFPGIDMRLKYQEAGVKSEFIIKENLHVKHLYFIDSLQLSSGLAARLDGNILDDHSKGHLIVYDKQTNATRMEIQPARTHDNSGSRRSWFNPYNLSGNVLELWCDSSILNGPQTVYPVTVDPQVTATANNGSSYLAGTLVSPAYCNTTINVTLPAGAVPTDVSPKWSIYSNWCFGYYTGHGSLGDDCWQSEAQVWISSSCGRSPSGATTWTCSGCNSTGNWNTTIAYGSSGTQSLVQCFTPSCSSQIVSFNINTSRTNCNSYSNYDGCTPVSRSYCQTLDNWGITVQGSTMETLNNSSTGNGSLSSNVLCNAVTTMDPLTKYGVTPYNYVWSSGGSSATKTVTLLSAGTESHSVTVTDACNTSRTASFAYTTDCALPVEFISFQGKLVKQKTVLNWSTATEQNSDYFVVEQSADGKTFTAIGKVNAAGNSNTVLSYQFTYSQNGTNKINYYRLKQFDKDGSYTLSKIIAVHLETGVEKMLCIPNPLKDQLQIVLSDVNTNAAYIQIYNLQGMRCLAQYFTEEEPLILNTSVLASGIYLVRAYHANSKLIGSNVIIKE